MYIEKNGKRITTRQMQREQDQLDAFQKEMNDYDLAVMNSTSGRYNEDSSRYFLTMRTEAEPVKGNKELIDQLIADDYKVDKSTRETRDGRRFYVFIVEKTVEIETANGADIVKEVEINPAPKKEETKKYTKLELKQERAFDEFQKEMDAYGLNVARAAVTRYFMHGESAYSVGMCTKRIAAKGNKKLMELLETAGYKINKFIDTDKQTGKKTWTFNVQKFARIPAEIDDERIVDPDEPISKAEREYEERQKVIEAFRVEMITYGMKQVQKTHEVRKGAGLVTMFLKTKSEPVTGNETMIQRLKDNGYHVTIMKGRGDRPDRFFVLEDRDVVLDQDADVDEGTVEKRLEEIEKRLDNLEPCEDNPVYAAEIRKLREEQLVLRQALDQRPAPAPDPKAESEAEEAAGQKEEPARFYSYTVRRGDGLTIGSVGVKEQAITAAKSVAAMTGKSVYVIAHRSDGVDRTNIYAPDGTVRKLWKEPEKPQQEAPTAREYPTLFAPVAGKAYTNHGGGTFRCLKAQGADATMMNMASGWTLEAHMCRQYKDGTIEWDWSTGGHFA